MFLVRYLKLVAHYLLPWVWFHTLCDEEHFELCKWYCTWIECMLEVRKFFALLYMGSEDQTWLIVCMLSQDCYFSILNHAVPFLSHVGTFRNFIQVMILHTKFLTGTTKLQKTETCLYLPFPIPLPPFFNLWSYRCASTDQWRKKMILSGGTDALRYHTVF